MQTLHQNLKVALLLMDAMYPTGSPDAVELFWLGLLSGIASHKHDAQDFVVRIHHGTDGLGPVLGRHQQRNRLTGKERARRYWQQMDDAR